MDKETAVRKLMQACEKDPELLTRLVAKPKEVAGEFGVTLEAEEIEQLGRVQKLQNLVAEFKGGRGIGHPVGYPIDVAWKTTLANHIIFYRPIYYPIFYPIFYPIGYLGAGYPIGPVEQARPFSGLRRFANRKRS